jgi:tetratricopeptide (TPR) repeat protein
LEAQVVQPRSGVRVGVLESCAALYIFAYGYPGLTAGATLYRPSGPASSDYWDRLESRRLKFNIKFLAGRIFAMAGQRVRAEELAMDLSSELQSEPQAYGKLIEGEIALVTGDPRKAIQIFSDSNRLIDTWISRFDLGRAYLEAGAFAEADSEFDRCIKRRDEALSLFLDESPTYGYFPAVYYYLGRVREAMKTAGFADSYRTYLSIRGKAGEDPLLADVRRRAKL